MADDAPEDRLAAKRRQFTDTWKCCICHEFPLSPFQTPCGHCMCVPCAEKLPKIGSDRACPICKSRMTSVMVQPQLAQTLESFAELLWPEVWAFWVELNAMQIESERRVFGHISAFVSGANEGAIRALRIFRFSERYGHHSYECRDMILEPLLVVEGGGDWDGVGPWLDRVITKCSTDLDYCFVSSAPGAYNALATEAAASRLIPLWAQMTIGKPYWADRSALSRFQSVAMSIIPCVPGGWSSLVDAPGFTWLAPVVEIARLFEAAPSVRMLGLLCGAIDAQAIDTKAAAGTDDSEDCTVDSAVLEEVARIVAGAITAPPTSLHAAALASDASASAASPAVSAAASAFGPSVPVSVAEQAGMDVAITKFLWVLCSKLSTETASSTLRRHGLLPGRVLGSTLVSSGPSAPAPAAASDSDVQTTQGRKRTRGGK